MSDFIISAIRTYVPILVGAFVSWLALKGINLDSSTVLALGTALGGVVAALYYTIIRLLEKKFPQVGVLLGTAQQPTYPPKAVK
jgi:uncharacterized membrane protein (DUF441 family)